MKTLMIFGEIVLVFSPDKISANHCHNYGSHLLKWFELWLKGGKCRFSRAAFLRPSPSLRQARPVRAARWPVATAPSGPLLVDRSGHNGFFSD